MAPKRKCEPGGIMAFMAKAQATAAKEKLAPAWVPATSIKTVPQDYVEELSKHFSSYSDDRFNKAKQLHQAADNRADGSRLATTTPLTAATPSASASIAADDLDAPAIQIAELTALRWQKKAVYCVEQLAAWAGTDVALQSHLQEKLAHILLNHRLHIDPLISLKAYQLLLKNLQKHPPVTAVPTAKGQPYLLEVNEHCWEPLLKSAVGELMRADTADGKQCGNLTGFEILQDLVYNAVLLVTGNENSSNITHRESTGTAASQGKALLLLYITQLLQADCNTRLAVFEEHMHHIASNGASPEDAYELRTRAASLLQLSLLFRLVEMDAGWREDADDRKGRHRLVRDLVLLATTDLDSTADLVAPATPPAATGGSPTPCPTPATPAPPKTAAAMQPVTSPELVAAARSLLLLLLELYSNCEAAGVYGGGSRLHSKRSVYPESDRCWLDIVLMKAMGALGAGHTLQNMKVQSAGPAGVERLLQFLPPVHRVRLAAMCVAVAVLRGHDPNPQAIDPLVAVFNYYEVKGKGNVDTGPVFVKSSAVDVASALTQRRWVLEKLLGGKEACALLLSSLVHAAIIGRQLHSSAETQQFKELMKPLLESVMQRITGGPAQEHGEGTGHLEVLFSFGSAMRLLA